MSRMRTLPARQNARQRVGDARMIVAGDVDAEDACLRLNGHVEPPIVASIARPRMRVPPLGQRPHSQHRDRAHREITGDDEARMIVADLIEQVDGEIQRRHDQQQPRRCRMGRRICRLLPELLNRRIAAITHAACNPRHATRNTT